MRRINLKAAVLSAALVVGAVAWASPAQAATFPGTFNVTRGAGNATGALVFKAGWPGSYNVTGTLSVAQNDGQCYYVRYYIEQDLLGSGVNSARQCGPGSVPLTKNLSAGLLNRGVVLALCSAAPGTPDEASITPPGANCTII